MPSSHIYRSETFQLVQLHTLDCPAPILRHRWRCVLGAAVQQRRHPPIPGKQLGSGQEHLCAGDGIARVVDYPAAKLGRGVNGEGCLLERDLKRGRVVLRYRGERSFQGRGHTPRVPRVRAPSAEPEPAAENTFAVGVEDIEECTRPVIGEVDPVHWGPRGVDDREIQFDRPPVNLGGDTPAEWRSQGHFNRFAGGGVN